MSSLSNTSTHFSNLEIYHYRNESTLLQIFSGLYNQNRQLRNLPYLSFYDEIKLLQVIKELDNFFKINIVPTFLGAHTFPPEYKNDHDKYIDLVINEMLPYVAEHNLAKFCDGFCEVTAFSAKQIGNER